MFLWQVMKSQYKNKIGRNKADSKKQKQKNIKEINQQQYVKNAFIIVTVGFACPSDALVYKISPTDSAGCVCTMDCRVKQVARFCPETLLILCISSISSPEAILSIPVKPFNSIKRVFSRKPGWHHCTCYETRQLTDAAVIPCRLIKSKL